MASGDMPKGPSMFNTMSWINWRDSVFMRAALGKPAISSPPLIIVNRRPDTRRHMLNRDEVAAAINARFPHCRVVYKDMTQLPYRKQLQLLQHAAVMVTTQGSHAFRFMLLPTGARVVLIGGPAVHAGDGNWERTLFFEVPKYFSASYIKFIKYVVNVGAKEEYSVPNLQVWPHWNAWNADIRVNLTRLLPLVRQAVDEATHEVAWRAKEQLPLRRLVRSRA